MKYPFLAFVKAQWTKLPPVAKVDLNGKTVIVTGANTGIGLETAKHFARMHPGRLIVTCRNKEKGDETVAEIRKETGFQDVEAGILDLSDFSSVNSFAEHFDQEGGRLDILVENAGIATEEITFTKDGWESSVQVNNLSTSLLALLLVPRMLETARKYNTTPRLVVVSSETHYWTEIDNNVINAPNFFRTYAHQDLFTPPLGDRYRGTKLLNLLFVRALNDRLHKKPLVVNAPNPGLCYSSLLRSYNGLAGIVYALMFIALGRTAEQGSRQCVWAAVGGEERKDELRGAYITLRRVEEPSDFVISEEGKNAQDKLWNDLIEELIKIQPRVREIVEKYLIEPVLN